MHVAPSWIVVAALSISAPLMAQDNGMSFEHGDWQLVCDNTRTCRAAGYQALDADSPPVSALLTRHAGPRQAVTAEIQVVALDERPEGAAVPTDTGLLLEIDGRRLGPIALDDGDSAKGTLSAPQTAALLAALTRDSHIQVRAAEGTVFTLSDRGASAVLLKMDDVQGRVGTTGALVRRGSHDESRVLPALPAPIVTVPVVGDTELALPRRERAQLLQAVKGATDAESCPDLFADSDSGDADADPLTVSELSGGKRLVAAHCWLAAYNYGVGYWVINARAPYEPTEVTLDGTGYELGQIVTAQKGRGVGDCWYAEAWAWNGHAFVAAGEHTTGLCRGFGGGAWTLPTLVTELR